MGTRQSHQRSLAPGHGVKLFVGGTDTGIGKTTTSAALMRLFPSYHYWKPVQTGDDSDTKTVQRLSGASADRFHAPAYELAAPVSPHLAAAREGKRIDIASLIVPTEPDLIIEGAGGLLVPYNDRVLQLDWVRENGFPILLVAEDRVGAINQTLLSWQVCRQNDVRVIGVLLNRGRGDVGNREAIAHWTKLPVWQMGEAADPVALFDTTGIELHLRND